MGVEWDSHGVRSPLRVMGVLVLTWTFMGGVCVDGGGFAAWVGFCARLKAAADVDGDLSCGVEEMGRQAVRCVE